MKCLKTRNVSRLTLASVFGAAIMACAIPASSVAQDKVPPNDKHSDHAEKKGDSQSADQAKEALSVRYARAKLKLAQMNLQKLLDFNVKTPGIVSESALEPLREVVRIAEQQLQYAMHEDSENLHNIHLANAEAKLRNAEAQLKPALAVEKGSPGFFGETEIERLRLKVEVARLGLAKARAINIHSPLEHLQWQVEELQEEVLQLHSRVERLSRHVGGTQQ